MQAELRRKYGECITRDHASSQLGLLDCETLVLTEGFRYGHYIVVKRKSEVACLLKSKQFQPIQEGKSQSHFAYNVSDLRVLVL